jgi:hypothetical protein
VTRSPVLGRTGAIALALAGALALGALSQAPYTADRAEHAVVRLAWRARGERVEQCRRLTPEELERLPAHMRQEERCEGRVLPYRLQLWIDRARAVNELVHAAGARRDRPLYVYHELPLEPGTHALVVTFTREGDIPAGAREQDKGTPTRLALDTTVMLSPRRILLVTYDDDARRLVVRDGPPPGDR